MQRYGDSGVNTNNWVNSFLVCCDRKPDLRQKGGIAVNPVALFTKKLVLFLFSIPTRIKKYKSSYWSY